MSPSISSTSARPPASMLERAHQYLACAVLAVLVVAGAVEMALASVHWPDFALPQGVQALREGRTTQALEKALERYMPQRDALITFANALRWRLTGGANEQVRLGRGDWIFLTEELQYASAGEARQQQRTALLRDAAQALAAKGVTLVVALVPDKARLHADLVVGGYPDYAQARYAQALSQLREGGVAVADTLAALQQAQREGEVYYRTDTHWNQRGAQAAARSVAEVVAPMVAQQPRTRFVTAAATAQPSERVGDLLRLMGLQDAPAFWRPAPDQERTETTTEQASAQDGASLFGDATVPVVLTGTSYSLRGNFHGYLQQALGVKVLNVARDGGGLLQASEKYLHDDAFLQTPPTVLVWEVPERFLTLALTDEAHWLHKVGLRP